MAVSNNDRISSARLLDTLRELQEYRYLGSEPVVETDVTEYPSVISPAVGTYQNIGELMQGMSTPDEARLPFKLYTEETTYDLSSFPITITQPAGNYVELTRKINVEMYGSTYEFYVEDHYEAIDTYTGYALYHVSYWMSMYMENGGIQSSGYIWEIPAKTETVVTKTKHTIKQDYIPNADWNVNDPDMDGYIENRTHWSVENRTGIVPKSGTYNTSEDLIQSMTEFNDIEPLAVYVFDAYTISSYPSTIPEYVGDPVTTLDREFEIYGLRVLGPASWDGDLNNPTDYVFIFKQEPFYPTSQVISLVNGQSYRWEAVYGEIHKLDKKYYDWVDKEALERSVRRNIEPGWYLATGDIELSEYLSMKYSQMYAQNTSMNRLYITYYYTNSSDDIIGIKVSTDHYNPKVSLYYFNVEIPIPAGKIYKKLYSTELSAGRREYLIENQHNGRYIPFMFNMSSDNFTASYAYVMRLVENDTIIETTADNSIVIAGNHFINRSDGTVTIVLVPYVWDNYYFVSYDTTSNDYPSESMSNPFTLTANYTKFSVSDAGIKTISFIIHWYAGGYRYQYGHGSSVNVHSSYETVPKASQLARLNTPYRFVGEEISCIAVDDQGDEHTATLKLNRTGEEIKSEDEFTCIEIYASIQAETYRPIFEELLDMNQTWLYDHEYINLYELV